ncbi:MAG: hypothetical protein QM758_10770 [Armatimonas sp.]
MTTKKPFVLILAAVTLLWTLGEGIYYLRSNFRPQNTYYRESMPALERGMVYATKESGQYHTANCRFAYGGVPMKQKQAERAGLQACLKCGG